MGFERSEGWGGASCSITCMMGFVKMGRAWCSITCMMDGVRQHGYVKRFETNKVTGKAGVEAFILFS